MFGRKMLHSQSKDRGEQNVEYKQTKRKKAAGRRNAGFWVQKRGGATEGGLTRDVFIPEK